MDQHVLKLNEFFIEGGQPEVSHVLLHLTEPSTPEEIERGYFFALCEINNGTTPYLSKIQEIIDQAENGYYEAQETPEKNALEVVLEKINQQAKGILDPDIALHCIIGAIREPDLIFTFYGEPQMVLFYKNRQGLYQKMDLITHNPPSETNPESEQLFSQLVQGKISTHDYLFVGTHHIRDYFDHDRLSKIITARPPEQSAQHIERVLKEIRDGYSFGGLILHQELAEQSPATFQKLRPSVAKGGSEKSLHTLFKTEQNTATTLSSSLFPRINSALKTWTKEPPTQPARSQSSATAAPMRRPQINAPHLTPHRTSQNTPRRDKPNVGDILKKIVDILWIGLQWIGKGLVALVLLIYSIVRGLVRGSIMLLFVLTNYQGRRQTILDEWRRSWRGHKENIKHLPLITKFIGIASLLAALVLAISIVYLRHHQKQLAAEMTFQEGIKTLKTKKDTMESALIYNNQASALQEMESATTLLQSLDCTTKEHQPVCSELKDQLTSLAVRLRKMVITTPTLITDWSGFVPNATSFQLVKVDSKIIGFSSSTNQLVSYDLLTKESKTISTAANISGFTEAAAPKENDYLLLLTPAGQFFSLNTTDNSVKPLDVSFPTDKSTPISAVIYNRRLYSLDALANQIYKHDSIKNGFAQGKEWIKDNSISLHDGADLAIDGDLFVLKNNGQVVKLTSGENQPFTIQGLDPALTNGGKIWTYTDSLYLYILDSAHKRLIILDKNGSLKQQITTTIFKNPTGMVIDETNGVGYVVDGAKLYQISLK